MGYHVQYDVTGAYLLAPPVRVQYARFSNGRLRAYKYCRKRQRTEL